MCKKTFASLKSVQVRGPAMSPKLPASPKKKSELDLLIFPLRALHSPFRSASVWAGPLWRWGRDRCRRCRSTRRPTPATIAIVSHPDSSDKESFKRSFAHKMKKDREKCETKDVGTETWNDKEIAAIADLETEPSLHWWVPLVKMTKIWRWCW